jgi:hypothetical protein
VHGDRIEAVVDGNIAGERVVNPLLSLDGDDRSPAGHGNRPLDRMHADVGAAVDRHHAVAVMVTPYLQKLDDELDFSWVEGSVFQELIADADFLARRGHMAVEAIDDHRPMV